MTDTTRAGDDTSSERGRTAVVSGGGTGIGAAIARSFASDGWQVAILGRREQVLRDVADGTPGIIPVTGDLSRPEDVEHVADSIVEEFGTLRVLVANAGSTRREDGSSLADVAEHWKATMAQNVLTAVLLERALRSHLQRPGGRVIAISSLSARDLAGNAAYGASKAALNRWVRALADELGGEGMTANAIAPGFVPDTELFGDLGVERVERIAGSIAVRRAGTPEDVASTVRWLASPEASFVNGSIIDVDGGARRRD